MAITQQTHTVTDEQVGRVDLVVRDLTALSRSKLRGLFDHQCVTVNGKACDDVAWRVAAGDIVTVNFDPQQGYKEKKKVWEDNTFKIIFEDDDLIVVDKQPGVLVNPAGPDDRNTLLERVSQYLSVRRKNLTALLVHRLERGASGLLVFAKHEAALAHLTQQFREQSPARKCIAIVMGTLAEPTGTFESWMGTRKNLDSFSMQEGASGGGHHAVTLYKVLKQQEETAVVEVEMKTSRRHQLRVHFAEAGHPVLGDMRYGDKRGDKKSVHDRWKKKRLAMHCQTLQFVHPTTDKPMLFTTPVPPAIRKFKAGP